MNWEQLLIPTEDLDCERLLTAWDWLLDRPYQPVAMTAFGDWFLSDDDAVYFLDLVAGRLFWLADSVQEFYEIMGRPENLERWFMVDLVRQLQESAIVFGPGQCYGYKLAPALGGRLEVGNIDPMDIELHQSQTGEMHRAIKDLPTGADVEDLRSQPSAS